MGSVRGQLLCKCEVSEDGCCENVKCPRRVVFEMESVLGGVFYMGSVRGRLLCKCEVSEEGFCENVKCPRTVVV